MKEVLMFIKTLRFRIILITALCWLLPTLILGGYLGGMFTSALREKTEAALMLSASHAEAETVLEIDRLVNMSKAVTYDNVLEDTLSKYRYGTIKYQEFFRTCRQYLDQKFSRERSFGFAMFYLIDEPRQIMATTGTDAQVDEFVRNAQAQLIELSETLDTKPRFIYVNGHTYLVRNLLNRKLKRFGTLVLGIDTGRILSPLLGGNEAWKGSIDIALDDFEYLQSGEPMAWEQDGLIERKDELLLMRRLATGDYTLSYCAHIDRHSVYGQIDQFNRLMLLLLLSLLPIAALTMVFVRRRLTRPLGMLAEASNRIEHGELGVTVDIETNDEVGRLARCHNGMSLQIKNLIEKSFEEELILRDARIEALQSRINPHFLNNTLEMINWQARLEGSDVISSMTLALSTLINAGLDRESTRVVPLSKELQVADAYFYFLDQRFGAKLRMRQNIEPDLMNVPVPRLVIQTLLENAVDHGIAPAGGGLVKLDIYAKGDMLYIDVTNTGTQLTAEDSARISQLLSEDNQDAIGKLAERLGIRNINRRAKLIYGDAAGLSLAPDENGNTLARLVLPMTVPE